MNVPSSCGVEEIATAPSEANTEALNGLLKEQAKLKDRIERLGKQAVECGLDFLRVGLAGGRVACLCVGSRQGAEFVTIHDSILSEPRCWPPRELIAGSRVAHPSVARFVPLVD